MKPKYKERARYKWQPLREAVCLPPSEALIADQIKLSNMTREQVLAFFANEEAGTTVWINDTYQVQRREMDGGMVHLNIRRRDGGAILRDWRHFQQIKNEMLGPECEAIELYPAESRKVDNSNKYHLYGYTDDTFRFPIHMFDKRDVDYRTGTTPGTRQRAL